MKRLLALALLVPALGGCFGSGKNPVKVVPGPNPWPLPSTPQTVLINLVKAYSGRDSTHYNACFDPGYVGQSYNGYDQFRYQPAAYTYDDEAAHIAALARNTSVYSVTLDLPNAAAAPREANPGDPAGWATIQIQNPKVQIDDASGSMAIATGEVFQFKFAPKLDDASPTDTTWTIVRWTEIAPVP